MGQAVFFLDPHTHLFHYAYGLDIIIFHGGNDAQVTVVMDSVAFLEFPGRGGSRTALTGIHHDYNRTISWN
jgi:hypothetical protein